jgi:hypothetical protein
MPLAITTSLQASLLARLDRLAPAREIAQTGYQHVEDQVVFNWDSEKHAPEQKVVRGTFSWTGGTGKYYSGEFLPLVEGTVVSCVTFEGSYRTPTQ